MVEREEFAPFNHPLLLWPVLMLFYISRVNWSTKKLYICL